MLETFLRDSGPYWHGSVTPLLLPISPIPKVIYWIETWWLWRLLECNEPGIVLLEVVDGNTVAIKGWTLSVSVRRWAVVFKWCSFGTEGTKVFAENILHPITSPLPAWTVDAGRMEPCFHVVCGKFWPNHLNLPAEIKTCFSKLLLSQVWSVCEL